MNFNLYLDDQTAKELDRAAKKLGETRSGLIRKALRECAHVVDGTEIDARALRREPGERREERVVAAVEIVVNRTEHEVCDGIIGIVSNRLFGVRSCKLGRIRLAFHHRPK